MRQFRFGVAMTVIAALGLASYGLFDATSASATAAKAKSACPAAPLPIVVSVDQWGDIVKQLAGDCGKVTTIFKSSSADPHDYEPKPADTAKFEGAKLVVVNGLDYDPWADKAVAALDSKPSVVNGGKVIGLKNGDNPHIWYGPEFVDKIADATTKAMKNIQPKAATYLDQRNAAWHASMKPYEDEIAKIKPLASGKTYGATEGIFDYMAQALGLVDNTPSGFAKATANESDPGPGDVNDFQQSLTDHKIDVLVYNTQTEGSIPQQVRSTATDAKIPIVDVTESVPPKFDTFESWQLSQLKSLATALGE
jgi:zinc/manganese transport system substrate-binding protein